MDNIVFKLATEFSRTPGSRHKEEGAYSGEECRNRYLEPRYLEARNKRVNLIVDLDGTIGYGTSFLEELFGGLARKFGKDEILKTLSFISEEEEYLIDDIKEYINNA